MHSIILPLSGFVLIKNELLSVVSLHDEVIWKILLVSCFVLNPKQDILPFETTNIKTDWKKELFLGFLLTLIDST